MQAGFQSGIEPTDWRDAPAQLALGEDELHVWLVEKRLASQCGSVLSADEHARAARFRFAEDQERYIATRGALRTLLGRYLGCAPELLKFDVTENGKPFLADSEIRFNASHAHELALIAFVRGLEVGVDVEYLDRRANVDELARAVLTEAELAEWRMLDWATRRRRFFRHWVRKEAYLKARGVGLSGSPRTLVSDDLPVRELAVPDGYAAAVATLEPHELQIRCYRF